MLRDSLIRDLTILTSAVVTLVLLVACSESPQRIEHNDPSKYALASDVLWASPQGFELTMDIYTPRLEEGPLPVLVMFHGGGWLINDKSIMNQPAAYLASNGRYVICNVNYRLLADNDNTVNMNQIVEDVFGAVIWVKEHIARYGGDPSKVAVTGDSAGGHLAAMIVNSGGSLSSNGFSGESLGFKPSYLPAGKTAEAVAANAGLDVQAAILSYGAFDIYQSALDGFERYSNPFWFISGSKARGIFGESINADDNAPYYQAVSPTHNIPPASERQLPPQLLTVGSEDTLVTPASVRSYQNALEAAGHSVTYWEHNGRPHAFLDSGSNFILGIAFERDAPPALDVMLGFLDGVFYN